MFGRCLRIGLMHQVGLAAAADGGEHHYTYSGWIRGYVDFALHAGG
jgi:hypothetical protein